MTDSRTIALACICVLILFIVFLYDVFHGTRVTPELIDYIIALPQLNETY